MATGNSDAGASAPAHTMRRRSTDRKITPPDNLPVWQGAPHDGPGAFAYTRPNPSFVAQLIATADRSPQTRTLRRADSADVDAVYRAAASNEPAQPGGTTRVVI